MYHYPRGSQPLTIHSRTEFGAVSVTKFRKPMRMRLPHRLFLATLLLLLAPPVTTLLIITPPTRRYRDLHHMELSPDATRIGSRLYVAKHQQRNSKALVSAESAMHVLEPIARAMSYGELLAELDSPSRPAVLEQPWTLRYESFAADDVGPRANECLCGVARYLPGEPAVRRDTDNALELVLVRTRRLWYLCRNVGSAPSQHQQRQQRRLSTWTSRPYSFSAATDPELALLAVSLALQHHAASTGRTTTTTTSAAAGVLPPVLLDPCCGSGTVLCAARLRGLRAVGCDLNPLAVRGARANLAFAAQEFGWEVASVPTALEHDCTTPLPTEQAKTVGLVVASLPWGREQRIPHARYLTDLLCALAASVPHASTFVCLSATPLTEAFTDDARLRAAFDLVAEAPVHGKPGGPPRCLLSILKPTALAAAAGATGQMASVAAAVVAADHEPTGTAVITALLSGGGQRGAGTDSAPPAPGELLEFQCRTAAHGRRWVRAHVEELT